METQPVHYVRAWSGVESDEQPVCGVDKYAPHVFTNRTIEAGAVTCPACLAAEPGLVEARPFAPVVRTKRAGEQERAEVSR